MSGPLVAFDPYCIRKFTAGDVEALARHANNRNVAANLRDRFPHPYQQHHAEEWLSFVLKQDAPTTFALATPEEIIGGIGLEFQEDVHSRSAELGYWLAEPYWGKGIMSRAVQAFTDYAFASYDLIRIFATTYHTNPASVRVLEKAGYEYEGRMRASVVKWGNLLDQLMYAKVKIPPDLEA